MCHIRLERRAFLLPNVTCLPCLLCWYRAALRDSAVTTSNLLHTGLQDELVELFASMDKAKGGVESGFLSKVCRPAPHDRCTSMLPHATVAGLDVSRHSPYPSQP